nr:hypothetical protein [Tanacetum cinerariifolium]
NQAIVQDGRVVVQNVQGQLNQSQGKNPRGGGAAGYRGVQNRVGNDNPGQARQIKCYNCNDVDEKPVQDLALNVDNVFQADDYDAFDSDIDEAPMAQTMFMANLSSADPVYDEAGPSYDSDILSEDNAVPGVQSNVSSVSNDAYMMIYYDTNKLNCMKDGPDLIKMKTEALKKQTTASRPIKALTVYPPNLLATLVPRVLPTKSQVKIHIFTLIQLFSEFDKICKKRITPTGLTEGERGFEQTKECYLMEKDVFEELEAEVSQNVVERKHDEIERKNLLITNDNLIAECFSKEVFYVATNSELNVARFIEMHVANTIVEARCLELEAELSNFHDKSHNDNHNELVNWFSNLE